MFQALDIQGLRINDVIVCCFFPPPHWHMEYFLDEWAAEHPSLHTQLTYHHQNVKCSHLDPGSWGQAEEREEARHDHFPHEQRHLIVDCLHLWESEIMGTVPAPHPPSWWHSDRNEVQQIKPNLLPWNNIAK